MPPGAWIKQVPPGAWIKQVPPGAWIKQVPPGAWINEVPPDAWIKQVPPDAWSNQVPPGFLAPGARLAPEAAVPRTRLRCLHVLVQRRVNVILWFVGGACLAVWLVFGDPRIDFRLVAVGAVLPDVLDVPFGGARVAHTLVFSVALLFVVMAVTRRGEPRRRAWLALPIGTFMHLALDGMWTRSEVFWWPFFGSSFGDVGLPSLDRPALVLVLQEAAGVAALVWFAAQKRAVAE